MDEMAMTTNTPALEALNSMPPEILKAKVREYLTEWEAERLIFHGEICSGLKWLIADFITKREAALQPASGEACASSTIDKTACVSESAKNERQTASVDQKPMVQLLRELGYTVTPPDTGPVEIPMLIVEPTRVPSREEDEVYTFYRENPEAGKSSYLYDWYKRGQAGIMEPSNTQEAAHSAWRAGRDSNPQTAADAVITLITGKDNG